MSAESHPTEGVSADASARGRHWYSGLPRPSVLEWLYLAIGLVLIARYRWLFDDSFVYFRYVDNFLFLDAGLSYNAGEFVEGYTSPLQCLALLALRSLHLSYPVIVMTIGVLCFTAFAYLLVLINRALNPQITQRTALNFPLLLLASNYSALSFFSAGNEGALTHLAAAATALYLLRPDSRLLAALVACSPLVRPELAAPLVLTVGYVWFRTGRLPRFLLVATAALNGAWLLFRIYYYADLLPNTFYLKDASDFAAGLRYLRDVTDPYFVGSIFAAFGVLAVLLAIQRRQRAEPVDLALAPRVAMLALAAAGAAYVVRSGGSSMHYYYLAAPFTLALCSLAGLLESGVAEFLPARRRWTGPVVALCLLGLSLSAYPDKLSRHPITGEERMQRGPSREVMTDPAWFRHRAAPRFALWPSIADLRAAELPRNGYRGWTKEYWCDYVYAHYDLRSVHSFGLTDGILARVDTPEAKRGHKLGLERLADDIIEIQREASHIGRGMFRESVEAGRAPLWVRRNLETIELIERKIYNRHDMGENLRLALSFPAKIVPYPEPRAKRP